MVVLYVLDTSFYLFFSVIADYIRNHFDLASFLEISTCVLVIDIMKNMIEIIFESRIMIQKSKMIVERAEEKSDIIEVSTVHSLMIYKMCERLNLPVKLASVEGKKKWVAKKKPQDREKCPVLSKSIFQDDSDVL
ncbi:hypothetical protein TNCT_1071 [Trichonephila clavata]|uniref:Uncharacterized protein n=1 Tax=Trichonephila clavata TaxID=2740835 RepID=A0A8X6G7F1_TRICU|nr:hypothetical protein TNCT_1071 [Trichonephila clavata]